MKKTAIVAIVVMALVFGTVAWATALDETVLVTARISPAFSIDADANAFDFGTLDLGAVESITGPTITVKSNRPWTYTEQAATSTQAELLVVESQAKSVTQGTEGSRGVWAADYTYSLDLSGDAAYDIPADTDMTLTYVYTAVQN